MAYQKYKTTPSKVQFLAQKIKKYKQLKKQTNKQTNKQTKKSRDIKQVRRTCFQSAISVYSEDLNIQILLS